MNESAERLRTRIQNWPINAVRKLEGTMDLDEALAAERRATVERIRTAAESKHPYHGPHPRLLAYSPGPGISNTYIWRPDLLAILDAEADR